MEIPRDGAATNGVDRYSRPPPEINSSADDQCGGVGSNGVGVASSKDRASSAAAGDTSTSKSELSSSSSSLSPVNIPKHPLQHTWVLWYCKPTRGGKWEDSMKEVLAFNTVEDFWAMYHHVQPATGLPAGSDYYMFKQGIEPMWEDSQNLHGGRWLVTVDRNRRDELLDHYWLELLLAIIGEQFDGYGEYVSGAVVNIRQKGDKVSLWTRDATKEEVNRPIGVILKQKLGITDFISYERHEDTKQKTGSLVKPCLKI